MFRIESFVIHNLVCVLLPFLEPSWLRPDKMATNNVSKNGKLSKGSFHSFALSIIRLTATSVSSSCWFCNEFESLFGVTVIQTIVISKINLCMQRLPTGTLVVSIRHVLWIGCNKCFMQK